MKDEVTNVLQLVNLVRENVRAKQLFTPYNSILVTLSGGQDSLCSLLLLYLLQNQLGLDLNARRKPTLTTSSTAPAAGFAHFRLLRKAERTLGLPAVSLKLAKGRVTVSTHKGLPYDRGELLLGRGQSSFRARPKHRGTLANASIAKVPKSKASLLLELKGEQERLKHGHILSKADQAPRPTPNRARYTETKFRLPFKGLPVLSFLLKKVKHEQELRTLSLTLARRPVGLKFAPLCGASESEPTFRRMLSKAEHAHTECSLANPMIANPSAEHEDLERISSVWVARPRQLNKNDRVARFTASRGPTFADLNPQRKVVRVQTLGAHASCSSKELANKLEYHSPLGPSILVPPFAQPFFTARPRTRLEKYVRFSGEFGVLWCNHFWQEESFYTMLHVAKINFCFSSTMCFFLPIENVLCEQNAREWRHKSIQRTCAFYRYDCCTQGHTKSDRVETILFNILRGTGIVGLQSLQWKKSFYSFSCQRFYPYLSDFKLNRPQSMAPLLKLPERLSKIGGFYKFCLVNPCIEPTFSLRTNCSEQLRPRLALSIVLSTNSRFCVAKFSEHYWLLRAFLLNHNYHRANRRRTLLCSNSS